MNVFKSILKIDELDGSIGIYNSNNEFNSIIVNSIDNKNIIIVCSSLYEASSFFQSISSYRNDVFFFPMDDFLSSEAIELNPELKTTRIETLNSSISSNDKMIIVTNLMGYLRFLPSKEIWKESIVRLKQDDRISYDKLIKNLCNIGYNREATVYSTGQIAIRGFIIDIFPIGFENPIRIEFFDDIIESIRIFDSETQKSIREMDSIDIFPFSEFIIDKESDLPREQKYLSKIIKPVNINDYLSNCLVIYKDHSMLKTSNYKIQTDIHSYSTEKNQADLKFMFELNDIHPEKEINIMTVDSISDIKYDKEYRFSVFEPNQYYSKFDKLNDDITDYLNLNKTIIICLNSKKELETLEMNIDATIVFTNENEIFKNSVNVIIKSISRGFIYDDYIILTEYELYNVKEQKINYKSDYKYGSKLKSISKLEIGDYVVHAKHGIGIYNGLKVLSKNNLLKDYIEVLYRGSDKLYIPVEKIYLLSKYSAKEGFAPKVNKLGTTEWTKTKLSISKKVENIAEQLLKLYAEREAKGGFAFECDTEEQILFENEFPYELTRDQNIAVNQIKLDMQSPRPMDRLLCGDVGFGKTEVAFRAMFKAAINAKQIMYLCPTTILSSQQYESAIQRFRNYPVNIGLLNRFTTTKVAEKIIKDFTDGKIDILFGTHRILSKDVIPFDLGLLVIDEEQRFGVKHKEKIKEYKSNVDVLTLSATPIPRTLQMSMVGLRDLSLIETPPVNRYPISTYVTAYNKNLIKEAIYNEMSRNGQVFILYNKIESITRKVEEIQNLIKEAKITYAHGAMSKNELENRMIDFINKKFDILVCTTIIETGIDIPNVNTLIIIDANNFGLSQLYQIRGRVGRTNKIAFAYLMYDENKVLTETAVKRLQTIKDFTHLGSGFKIASRDLSIRGAGDFLGSEQAGFIDSVGIELYTRILNEEVMRLKGIKVDEAEEIETEKPMIDVATHIDSKYVTDDEVKIEIHEIVSKINSYNSLLESKEQIEDRFGKISDDLDIYMHECWFEKMAREINIKNIHQSSHQVEFQIPKSLSDKIDGQKLFYDLSAISMEFRFNYRHGQIGVILNTSKVKRHFIYYLIEALLVIKKYNIE